MTKSIFSPNKLSKKLLHLTNLTIVGIVINPIAGLLYGVISTGTNIIPSTLKVYW